MVPGAVAKSMGELGGLRGGLAPIVLRSEAGSPPVEIPEGPFRTRAPPDHPNSPVTRSPLTPHPTSHPFTHACQAETQSSLKGNKYPTSSIPELPAPRRGGSLGTTRGASLKTTSHTDPG